MRRGFRAYERWTALVAPIGQFDGPVFATRAERFSAGDGSCGAGRDT